MNINNNQRGAVSIIMTLLMLTGIVIISLSIVGIRHTRLQFFRQTSEALQTQLNAISLREQIVYHFKNGGSIDDWLEPASNCSSNNWKAVGGTTIEYCIQNISGVNYILLVRTIGSNLVQHSFFSDVSTPSVCLPKENVSGLGPDDCRWGSRRFTDNIGGVFLMTTTYCNPKPSWGNDYKYNVDFEQWHCEPEDCNGDESSRGVPVRLQAPGIPAMDFQWYMYGCTDELGFENQYYSGVGCTACPYGWDEESIVGHAYIPDGTYQYCRQPGYWTNPQHIASRLYASDIFLDIGPVCFTPNKHQCDQDAFNGSCNCTGDCNVEFQMWDEDASLSGEWALNHVWTEDSGAPEVPSCLTEGFDHMSVYGVDFLGTGKTYANDAFCTLSQGTCYAFTNQIDPGVLRIEERFSCVPNIRFESPEQGYKWIEYKNDETVVAGHPNDDGYFSCSIYPERKLGGTCDPSATPCYNNLEYQGVASTSGLNVYRLDWRLCQKERVGWTLREPYTSADIPICIFSPWHSYDSWGSLLQQDYDGTINERNSPPVVCPVGYECLSDSFSTAPAHPVIIQCRDTNPCPSTHPLHVTWKFSSPEGECCPVSARFQETQQIGSGLSNCCIPGSDCPGD